MIEFEAQYYNVESTQLDEVIEESKLCSDFQKLNPCGFFEMMDKPEGWKKEVYQKFHSPIDNKPVYYKEVYSFPFKKLVGELIDEIDGAKLVKIDNTSKLMFNYGAYATAPCSYLILLKSGYTIPVLASQVEEYVFDRKVSGSDINVNGTGGHLKWRQVVKVNENVNKSESDQVDNKEREEKDELLIVYI